MADVIRKARPKKKARFVCMEGADELVRDNSYGIVSLDYEANTGSLIAKRVLCYLC